MNTLRPHCLLAALVLLGCGDDDVASDASIPDVPVQDTPVDAPERESLELDFEEITLVGAEPEAVTNLRFIPGSAEFLLATKVGDFFHFELEGDSANLLGTFSVPTSDINDCGLIDVQFAPDFATSQRVYVARCETGQFSIVTRHRFDPADYEAFESSEELIVRVGAEEAREDLGCHNVGSIGFYPDDSLFAVFGEKRLPDAGRGDDTNLGKAIRIVPNEDGPGYTPHPSNPVGDDGQPRDWIASGLRSPFRAVLDSFEHLWIGDVGEGSFEEVNVIAEGVPNFGWPDSEGPCLLEDCSPFTDPVRYWDRSLEADYVLDDPEAEPSTRRVVWVAAVQDETVPDQYDGRFDGRFLMGDFCVGFVRAVEPFSDGQVRDEHAGHLTGVTATDQAADGFHYAATYGNCFSGPYRPGGVYRVVLR